VRAAALLILVALVAACDAPAAAPVAQPPEETEAVQFEACSGLPAGEGAKLPEVSVPCFTGGEAVQVKRWRGPMVINFWASWCGPCVDELPAFQRLAQAGGVPVVGVVTGDRRDRALSLATELGVTFPTLFDADARFRRAQGEVALPLTLFVTAGGEVSSYSGPALTDETLAALVAQRLGGRM
jgi:thiol-disulfide isomerase/thioredoxin